MLQDCLNSKILLPLAVGARLPNDSFFEQGNTFISHIKKYGIYETDCEDLLHEPVTLFCCDLLGCNKKFDTVFQFEQHYNSNHRYSCGTCKKALTSPHLLDLHICETHDSYFAVQSEKKPMFRCYLEECTGIFSNPQKRKQHCIENHSFPSNFFNGKSTVLSQPDLSGTNKKRSKKQQDYSKKMEMDLPVPTPGNKQLGDIPQKTKPVSKSRGKKQDPNISAPSEKMEITEKSTKNKNKSLGSGNKHNRGKIFVSFEKDMADSLPKLDS